jgi:N utilization substance protein B
MGKRRRARELALFLLYQLEFHPDDAAEATKVFWEDHPTSPEIKVFAENLVRGTLEHREVIDRLIASYAQHWRLPRMAVIDRNILRMAVYELLWNQETPEKVIINEAIELAKTYGAEDSGRFVNGILDQIKALRGKPLPPSDRP